MGRRAPALRSGSTDGRSCQQKERILFQNQLLIVVESKFIKSMINTNQPFQPRKYQGCRVHYLDVQKQIRAGSIPTPKSWESILFRYFGQVTGYWFFSFKESIPKENRFPGRIKSLMRIYSHHWVNSLTEICRDVQKIGIGCLKLVFFTEPITIFFIPCKFYHGNWFYDGNQFSWGNWFSLGIDSLLRIDSRVAVLF